MGVEPVGLKVGEVDGGIETWEISKCGDSSPFCTMPNEDYRDMLRALVDEKVRFLLVGAYALAAHGYPRATMDIDIWVMPAPENADAVLRALRRFGAPHL